MTLDERFEWINKNIESLHSQLGLLADLTVKNTENTRDVLETARIQNHSISALDSRLRRLEEGRNPSQAGD